MNEAKRIDWARKMMWERATLKQQSKWLRMADEAEASLREALARPAQPTSLDEATR